VQDATSRAATALATGASTLSAISQSRGSTVPEGGRARLVLVHRGIPVERIEEHARGWDHFLRLLDAAAAA